MYAIVEAKLAELTKQRDAVERQILGDPKLLSAPSGHPMKILRGSLRDQVILLRALLAESDHS